MQTVIPPYPQFNGSDGQPLEGGYIYIGTAGLNPETNPVSVYFDRAATIPAAQPVRTSGGFPTRYGSPANLFVSGDYSITVKDLKGNLVYYSTNVSNTAAGDNASLVADFAAITGAAMIGYSPDSGGTTGVQAANVAVNLNARTRSILDFIPKAKHAAIRARTSTDDLTTYFQNAAIAVNRDITIGAGTGGKVLVPAGRYRTNRIGCRDTQFEGEHITGTLIEAHTAGAGTLLDGALDRDGSTVNTSSGMASFTNMKVDGRGLGYSGVRSYGGFSKINDLWVTGCVDGINIGLPIAMEVQRVYSTGNSGKGFHTYSGAGDIATSLSMLSCWGSGNGTYNFHVEQLSYSTFMDCASQAIPATGRGWFVEGSTNGAGVGSSLHFIACASEGDLGEPFYFKRQRGLVVSSPKIISPPANKHLITFDDSAGTLQEYNGPTPGAGYYGLIVINSTAGDGAIAVVGGSMTMVDAHRQLVTNLGAAINAVREVAANQVRLMDPIIAQQMALGIEDIDGYTGAVLKAPDGTKVMRLRRAGTPIFYTNGAIATPAVNLGLGDVSFYVDTAAGKLMFVCKDGSGNVKSGFVAIA